ncbi:hypothetical protein BC833DRAFT_623222 [Globomyces pollinis-pini]|nr:hypothetical protein BC833DRAFT_623222 [Globomyces pollinis-pini]KAJ2994088.1 hypothetical protein HDV02_001865 [Globomyces sp. JEL0801]
MGKSKSKFPRKNGEKEVTDKELNASNQGLPKHYRQFLAAQNHKKRQTESEESLKPKKDIITDKSNPKATIDLLRKKANAASKVQTKKYKKRKEYMNSKSKKLEKELSRGEIVEQKLSKKLHNHKFNDQVLEPPKISTIPKMKFKQKIPTTNSTSTTTMKDQLKLIKKTNEKIENAKFVSDRPVGRKSKLKDLSESERSSLLKERERLIELYRLRKGTQRAIFK